MPYSWIREGSKRSSFAAKVWLARRLSALRRLSTLALAYSVETANATAVQQKSLDVWSESFDLERCAKSSVSRWFASAARHTGSDSA